ncbi:MAG: IS630 family transposase [Pirellulaceae bacterium]
MDGIVGQMSRADKRRLEKRCRNLKDGDLKTRYLIVLNLVESRSVTDTARALKVGRSTVYRVARRFREKGVDGLVDQREENGTTKMDDAFLSTLWEVVESSPLDYGWKRPTWTREMLVETMETQTGVKIHVSTMSVALAKIGARRGRPKPIVESTWSKRAKNKRLRELQELVDDLAEDEVAVYEDEVDIHLNPKIGLDWMVKGQQKEVLTPGQNEKRYLAGALNAKTGELIWVEGDSKNSLLFIQLLWQLHERYPNAKKIHVILDNYSIHSTEEVARTLASKAGQRFALHFLPPYCPDHNKIERAWQDLHANVTRNHKCSDISNLMKNVRHYLKQRNRSKTHYATAA